MSDRLIADVERDREGHFCGQTRRVSHPSVEESSKVWNGLSGVDSEGFIPKRGDGRTGDRFVESQGACSPQHARLGTQHTIDYVEF